MNPPAGVSKLTAAAKAMRVLEALSEPGTHHVSTLTRATGLNKATILRILAEFEHEDWVTRDEDRAIRLGPQAIVLASAIERQPGLRSWARPGLRRLADATGDNAILSIRCGAEIVCVERELGTHPVRASYLVEGRRLPLGAGSNGIALLAALPEPEAEALLTANAQAISGFGRIQLQQLRTGIARARVAGYAVATNIVSEGTGGISVALRKPDGCPFGTLTVAAIGSRILAREPELHELLRGEAALIEASARAA